MPIATAASLREPNWKLYSWGMLGVFLLVQLVRLSVSPQDIDIYYHLLTAWGFIQAGGYSGWDFWNYAPAGRVHIYPPLFHLLLAGLLKLGIEKFLLVKILELLLPFIFLCTLYGQMAGNFSRRFGFWVLLFVASSYSWYLSLAQYLPATLGMILGLGALGQLFRRSQVRACLLLALCFYTHAGISYFFTLAFALFGACNKEWRKIFLGAVAGAVFLALPILIKQVGALGLISFTGLSRENYFCEFKPVDALCALMGLGVVWVARKKYLIFVCLLLASAVFAAYPYRLFSAQGYLPVALLAAVFAEHLYERCARKAAFWGGACGGLIALYCLCFSPTFMANSKPGQPPTLFLADTVLTNTFSAAPHPRVATILTGFPHGALRNTASLISAHSKIEDIVYSNNYLVGVSLAALSGRATANRMLPEIKASRMVDPVAASKILVFLQDTDPALLAALQARYGLVRIGEDTLFILFENRSCQVKAGIRKADVSFNVAACIGVVVVLAFCGVVLKKL